MKEALIAGGTTGMGRATAELLLNQGISVAILARNRWPAGISRTEKKSFCQIVK
ncbi:hypothetical protein Cpin_6045 [Chitinophaga pinensis DSM 2588]|uniref:SDR family NAD(P)-dependent oxidoreductase n=1 Tax=Chitinophaga pinensis (strain ATCC 43595 / DSM 2588 / LMG 13176 / NBRC 15968 / NCIMB 11800 / UQM 2034) TaxID=485918 RepID=A0A979GT13_CHIPD|nr:hypothetical protein Cpin_6045 [Chitinophaga pinensis DSM 2588]